MSFIRKKHIPITDIYRTLQGSNALSWLWINFRVALKQQTNDRMLYSKIWLPKISIKRTHIKQFLFQLSL